VTPDLSLSVIQSRLDSLSTEIETLRRLYGDLRLRPGWPPSSVSTSRRWDSVLSLANDLADLARRAHAHHG